MGSLMIDRNRGFTLLEVLLAGFILFLTLTSMTLIYRGAILSSAKAEEALSVTAAIPSIRVLIAESFQENVKRGSRTGEGTFGDVIYRWKATVSIEGRPSAVFQEDSGLSYPIKYLLWDIEFSATKNGYSRQYRFTELGQ